METHETAEPSQLNYAKPQTDEEYKQTLKMKPKVSKRLPSAFGSLQRG